MKRFLWLVPAVASLGFFAFSVRVMMTEGPFGFIAEHGRNGWGAQIAIDLFTSVAIGLFLAVPRARRYGVRAAPWIVLTILTGSIGLLAFIARVLYAREEAARERARSSPLQLQKA